MVKRPRTRPSQRPTEPGPAGPLRIRADGRLVVVQAIDCQPGAALLRRQARTLADDRRVWAAVVARAYALYRASWYPDAEEVAEGAVAATSTKALRARLTLRRLVLFGDGAWEMYLADGGLFAGHTVAATVRAGVVEAVRLSG